MISPLRTATQVRPMSKGLVPRASWVMAHGSSGCRPEFFHLLETRQANISYLVDVGAQFGSCSVMAARRFPWLRVAALEVSPQNVRLIEQSAAASGISGRLHAEAVMLAPDLRDCSSQVLYSRRIAGITKQ